MRGLALGVLGLSWLLSAAAAVAQEASLTKEQQEVWNREEAYWHAVRARDANAYIALWHEDFVGWPYFDEEPIRKSDVRKNPFPWVRNSNNAMETFEITRKAVQVFGETAVVHYLVTGRSKQSDGKVAVRVSRITHMWMRSGGVWLIVGGMSSRVEPPEPSK